MSWLSSIGNAIGGAVKKVVSVAAPILRKVATPLLSTVAGFVPGVGPHLSKGVDMLGNALLGDSPADPTMDSGQVEQTPVMDAIAQAQGTVIGLGNSPVAQAMAASVNIKEAPITAADNSATGEKKGFLGIGDGKPGVFGIGTGKAKAAKAAREQAEAAAKGEGLTPKEIKLAGDKAAAKAEADTDKPAAGTFSPIALAAAALLALLAL